jgi:AcrR family transcriptional regulator
VSTKIARTNGNGGVPGGRRARALASRRAEVLAMARRLFAVRGYQRSTMVQLAAASELALGTLYQIFPSKEAILANLLEDYVDVLVARVRQAIAEADGPETGVERAVRTQLEFSQENADVLRLYLHGWTGYEFAVRQRFGARLDAKYEQYLDALTAVFRRGAREGLFAPDPPRRLAVALAGTIHGLIRRWLQEKQLDLLGEGEALARLFLRGVLRGGREQRNRR